MPTPYATPAAAQAGLSAAFSPSTPAQTAAISAASALVPTASAAPATATSVAPTGPTLGDLFGSVPSPNTLDTTGQNIESSYGTAGASMVDPTAIRTSVTNDFQDRLNAINNTYAQMLSKVDAQIGQQNANRSGQTTAILAARGLTGSGMGAAQTTATDAYNATALNGAEAPVQQQRQSALDALNGQIDTAVNNEISRQTAAKTQGAAAYIDYIKNQQTNKAAYAQQIGTYMVQNGIDPATLTPDQLSQLAAKGAGLGLTSGDITSAYSAAKTAAGIANKPVGVAATDNTFTFNPESGKYEQVGSAAPLTTDTKDYQAAVAQGYEGSLLDFLSQKANLKTSISGSRDPLTGALQTYQRAGPGVSQLPTPAGSSGAPVTLPTNTPAGTSATPAASASAAPQPSGSTTGIAATTDPAKPFGLDPSNTLDALTLQFIQTGTISGKAKSYPGYQAQIIARAQQVIPGFNPAVAQGNAGEIGKQIAYVADTTRAINTADANFNLLLTTLGGKVNDDESPLANQLTNLVQGGYIGNADVDKLKSAVTSLQTEYSQVLGRGGTVDDQTRNSAANIINGSYSMHDLQQVYSYIKQEGQNVVEQGNKEIQNLSTYGGSDTSASTPKGNMDDATYVQTVLSGQGLKYQDVMSQIPAGQKGVILNSTGQIGHIPPNEFDPSVYTSL